LLNIALNKFSEDCQSVNYIEAKVKISNTASNNIFLNMGFHTSRVCNQESMTFYRLEFSKSTHK